MLAILNILCLAERAVRFLSSAKEEKRLGERLRELRKVHGYTQDYVASFLGVIRQTYSHYETGRCMPPTQALYKLAGLYRISVEDLLHIAADPDSSYEPPEKTGTSDSLAAYLDFYTAPENRDKYRYLSDREKQLLYFFSTADESNRRDIIDYAEFKANKGKRR